MNHKLHSRWLTPFRLGVLIYASLLVLLSLTVLFVLRGYLAAYERSLPKNTAEEYLSSLDADRLTALFTAVIDPDGSENAAELIRDKYVTPFLSSRKDCLKDLSASASGNTAFILTSDGKNAIRVRLTPEKGGAGFGLDSWTVDGAEVLPAFVDLYPCTFAVPVGAAVTVNGKPYDSQAILYEVPYPGLHPLDQAGVVRFSVYSIAGLHKEPNISVTLGGKTLTKTISLDDLSYYVEKELTLHTYYVTVPENVVLTVNGIRAETETLSAEDYFYPLSPYESEDAVPLSLRMGKTYALTGFHARPQITATLGGTLLSSADQGDTTVCQLPPDVLHTVTITVPEGAEITVNGYPVTGITPVLSFCEEISFTGIENYVKPLPQSASYTISGLYNTPGVVVTLHGSPLSPVSPDDPFTFGFPPQESIPEDRKTAADDFINAYLVYVTHGYPEIDENMKSLLSLMLYGTDSYSLIYKSYEAYYWIRNHKETHYCNVDFTEYTPYGDNLFTCLIPFDIETVRGTIPVHVTGTVYAVFVRTYAGWKVGAFAFR